MRLKIEAVFEHYAEQSEYYQRANIAQRFAMEDAFYWLTMELLSKIISGDLEYKDGGILVHSRLDQIQREQKDYQEEDTQYKKQQLSLNRKTVRLNAILATATLIGGGINVYQAHIATLNATAARDNAEAAKQQAKAARDTVEQMRNSGTDTHDLAVAAGKQAQASQDEIALQTKVATAVYDAHATRGAMYFAPAGRMARGRVRRNWRDSAHSSGSRRRGNGFRRIRRPI